MKIIKVLDQGGFAVVFLAQDASIGTKFALKGILAPNGEAAFLCRREIDAMFKLRHCASGTAWYRLSPCLAPPDAASHRVWRRLASHTSLTSPLGPRAHPAPTLSVTCQPRGRAPCAPRYNGSLVWL